MHAFPATSNAASNDICRSFGCRFVSETGVTFAIVATARVSRPSNHWLVGLACRQVQPNGPGLLLLPSDRTQKTRGHWWDHRHAAELGR
ncbi:hypothetical protein ABZY81_33700 [Streptomyces sp. NPDC006514]|uniref:hypothetical protein n=1 Tax=Streptomyces sp. NPDC006514 TaxID=3154308 RepID=UPI0033A5E66A